MMSSPQEENPSTMITLLFRIHYYAEYGHNLYVVGNHLDLGAWNPLHALRLKWHPGHEWRGKIRLSLDDFNSCSTLEYKYIVARSSMNPREYSQADLASIRWEEGANREIDTMMLTKPIVKLEEIWEYRKMKLRFRDDDIDPTCKLFVMGSIENIETPRKMAVIMKRDEQTQKFAVYWQAIFNVPSRATHFSYRYMLKDERSNVTISERSTVSRHCDLNLMGKVQLPQNTISYTLKNNTYKRVDTKFMPEFHINHLDKQLMSGPQPITKGDVKTLKDCNIKCVLHIGEDHKTWQDLKVALAKQGITAKRTEFISKLEAEDFVKVHQLINSIELLIQKYGNCYIFSTPFKISQTIPTSIVSLYHWFLKGKNLEESINLAENRTFVGVADRMLIETIIEARRQKQPAKELEIPKPIVSPLCILDKPMKREISSTAMNVCQ